MQFKPNGPLLTWARAAVELGVDRKTLKRWQAKEIIPPPTVIDGCPFIRRDDVVRLKRHGDGSDFDLSEAG
jgi:predicted site-specific integrase-resolvase